MRFTIQKPYGCFLYEKDEVLSFRNKPNLSYTFKTNEYEVVYNTNEDGIREQEGFRFNKKGGEMRILTAGDSMTYGLALNKQDTFQERLEKKLSAISNKKIEVINTGVSGYGTKQTLDFLKMNLKDYEPDMVIFSFYNNDVMDDINYKNLTIEGGCLISKNTGPLKKFLYFHSRIFLLYQSSKDYLIIGVKPVRNTLYKIRKVLVSIGLSEHAKLKYPILERQETPEIYLSWQETLNNIKGMDDLCKENSCTFILVYIPSRIQVNPLFREDYLKRNNLKEEDFDFHKPPNRLRQFSKENGITFIDLQDEFSKLNIDDSNLQVYYSFDLHFNKNGAEVFSSILLKKITQLYKTVP